MKLNPPRKLYEPPGPGAQPLPDSGGPAVAPGTPVLLALSGGVDSSVAALLLRRLGYAVQGAVIRFSPAHQGAVDKARQTAGQLGVPLHVVDAEAPFTREVIRPFCAAYAAGETPNPCVLCNPKVKFALLAAEADRLGIGAIASGHYARTQAEGGFTYAAKAKSLARDQSYMLYRLPQAILARLVLPLGGWDKRDIRALARENGLSSADTPDSQEICFVPDGDYPAYIEAQGFANRPGRFVGPGGEDYGPHRGVVHYTVGQRKGLGVAAGRPVYVQAILPNGDIQLCDAKGTWAAGVELDDLFTTDDRALAPGEEYEVKIRSTAKPAPATVQTAGGGQAALRFQTPQFAAAPGQHAVLYQGPLVIGGGRIVRGWISSL